MPIAEKPTSAGSRSRSSASGSSCTCRPSLDGLDTTVGHLFKPKVTEQYPEQEPDLPPNYRGVHRLNRDERGPGEVRGVLHVRHRLPGPLHRHRRRPGPGRWTDREKYPETFVIDELRCIYCGMCEEACPVDAIELTTLYDLTGLSREQMMFDKEKLLSVFDQTTKAGTDPVRTQAGRLGSAPARRAKLPADG